MSNNNFNPSNRNPCNFERYCSECRITFTCDGSCEEERIKLTSFCLCPRCWETSLGKDRDINTKSKSRKMCSILKKYLETLRIAELGDDN